MLLGQFHTAVHADGGLLEEDLVQVDGALVLERPLTLGHLHVLLLLELVLHLVVRVQGETLVHGVHQVH